MPVLSNKSTPSATSRATTPAIPQQTLSIRIKIPPGTKKQRPVQSPSNSCTWANASWIESIQPGQTVVEIGSGTGTTCLDLAHRVGTRGRVVGIDSAPHLVEKASQRCTQQGHANIEFYLSRIDSIPLPEASADWVISNRQINFAANKLAVFREISRTLKPGGCLAIRDIALKKLLPAEATALLCEYLEGLTGAIEITTYQHFLQLAGFARVAITDSGTELILSGPGRRRSGHPPQVQGNLYGGPSIELALASEAGLAALRQYNLNHYVAVVDILAIR